MRVRRRRRAEQGSSVVVVLMALVLVSMLGSMCLMHSKTETQISGHHQRHTQALYNAEAGYVEALARVSATGDTVLYAGPGVNWQSEPGWGRYIVRQSGDSALDPDYDLTLTDGRDNDGDGSIDESGEHYPEILTAQSAGAVEYPWVKMQFKTNGSGQIVLLGDHDHDITTPPQQNFTAGDPVMTVTSRGDQGTAHRVVAVEAGRMPVEIPYTAVYSESDDFQFNGTQFLMSGQDWDPVTGAELPGNPSVPGIVTTGDPTNIAGALNAQQQNNVEGSGALPSVTPSGVNLDMHQMAQIFSDMAEIVVPDGNYTSVTWGSLEDYTIVHVTGGLDLSGNNAGGGILVIDGDFDCTGQFTWYGLVLVLGEIRFTGGGSGIHIYGSVLVEGGLSQQVVGGNADIKYSSLALQRISTLFPYVVLSWLEV
jgi:hypothetical protein